MGCTTQRPFALDLLPASQEKLAKSASLFDLAKDRLPDDFPFRLAGSAPFRAQLPPHPVRHGQPLRDPPPGTGPPVPTPRWLPGLSPELGHRAKVRGVVRRKHPKRNVLFELPRNLPGREGAHPIGVQQHLDEHLGMVGHGPPGRLVIPRQNGRQIQRRHQIRNTIRQVVGGNRKGCSGSEGRNVRSHIQAPPREQWWVECPFSWSRCKVFIARNIYLL